MSLEQWAETTWSTMHGDAKFAENMAAFAPANTLALDSAVSEHPW